ncbi:gamma-glutamyltransferase [Neomoorella mulderi]|uniref:Glutathione hydrolase proenzyme n=1 Tax=Moorella mulderi DSM 14980 TaxID=1122241 RepID=A0A151B0H2_9FIRM|nr:gamma-glutamyltransferase [Moorella mulderi]KYH33137.1 putative gamma-glutamyltransferase YwrD [Moorella mulderi DSM 14980]
MYRPIVMGTNGMVAAAHPLASLAGVNILKRGGNAIDAAIAINAVLNVTQPHMCGIGGDLFYLIYLARTREVIFLNGSGRAPRRASLEFFREKRMVKIPPRSAYAVTVPGCVAAWEDARERYGTMPLADLLAEAITYAEGHPVSHKLAWYITEHREVLSRYPDTAAIFLPGGRPPRPGDILRQDDLAATFRLLAREGKAAFYQGPIAEAITRTVQEEGGFLALEDLAGHTSTWGQPVATTYRGYTIYETAPNSQGLTALLEFNLVEGFDLKAMGLDTSTYIHHLVEAKKLAFADRDAYISDPDFVQIPIDHLLSKDYAAKRRRLIDPQQAMEIAAGSQLRGDTTYFAVVDREGNIVSCIQSIYFPFGSGLVARGTGILLQSRGAYFSLDPSHPNCLSPGKRTLHTLMAAIITKGDKPCLVFGTMGADGQPQTHLQVISRFLDFGCNIQEAIEAPRWIHGRALGDGPPSLNLENRFDPTVIEDLRRLGHKVTLLPAWSNETGHAQGIVIDYQRGVLMGGADPRGDGYALGW